MTNHFDWRENDITEYCPLCGPEYLLKEVTEKVTYDFTIKKGSMELVEHELSVNGDGCSNCKTTFFGYQEARTVEDFQRKILDDNRHL